jgi:phage anti-repressor protein
MHITGIRTEGAGFLEEKMKHGISLDVQRHTGIQVRHEDTRD